jgi:hypothetical protein
MTGNRSLLSDVIPARAEIQFSLKRTTNLDARFRGHDEPSTRLLNKQLFIFLRSRPRPLRAITVIGDSGDGVTAVDVEDRSRYVTGAIRS